MNDSAVPELRASTEEAATPAGAVVSVVAFEGDLDLASVEGFEAATAAAPGPAGTIVDLSRVRFIDSSGIHAIVRTRMSSAERGAGFELVVEPSSAVERVLGISGLREELAPHGDREAALAALDERERAAGGAGG